MDKARRHGFTLIEVLLALTLGGMVISLAGQTAVQSLLAERAVNESVAERSRLDHVPETISLDWNNRITGENQPTGGVVAELDAHRRPVLRFDALMAQPTTAIRRPLLPCAVTYRLVRSHSDGAETFHLLREATLLTREHSAASVQTLARDVTDWTIEVFADRTWQPAGEAQGQRTLNPLRHKDFHQEGIIPAAFSALADNAVL